ncbi:MAG: transposase, partial [Eubacteriales bacterium]|nr:transposase [Eubacteriales bacterium]
ISRTMSRIGTSYACWYNRKYGRRGHVFQGRYGSECVENDDYMLTVIRYIYNNPVKAGIVQEPENIGGAVFMLIMGPGNIHTD